MISALYDEAERGTVRACGGVCDLTDISTEAPSTATEASNDDDDDDATTSDAFPDYGIALITVGVVGLIVVVAIVAIFTGKCCSSSTGSRKVSLGGGGTGSVEMQSA